MVQIVCVLHFIRCVSCRQRGKSENQNTTRATANKCVFLITYSSIADLRSLADCQLKKTHIPGTFNNDIVKNA